MTNPHNSQEQGQSLVLIALLMMAMIAFLGLVIDGGDVYVTRRNAQDSADSAAFAGARLLASKSITVTKTTISNTISSFAKENGVASSNDVIAAFIDQNGNNICLFTQPSCSSIPASATGVRVTVTIQYQPSFINLVTGNGTVPIPAVAAAQSGTPTAAGNSMPVVMPISTTGSITYGQSIDLWGDKVATGSFQWVSFGCVSNPQDFTQYLNPTGTAKPPHVVADPTDQSTTPTTPPTDSWVCTGPGVSNDSTVRNYLDLWLAMPAERRHWLVMMFDYSSGNGSNVKFHIVRFAEVVLQGYRFGNGNGNNNFVDGLTDCINHTGPNSNTKCIVGKFIKYVAADDVQFTPGPCNTNGMAICGIGLSQ